MRNLFLFLPLLTIGAMVAGTFAFFTPVAYADFTTANCPSISNTPLPFNSIKGTVKLPNNGPEMQITGGLVTCGRICDDPTTEDDPNTIDDPITPVVENKENDESASCTITSFFSLFNRIVQTALFVWMPLIIAMFITGGGFLIMTSRESAGQRLKGKQIIQWALLGYGIMLLAWVIVNTFFGVIGIADWQGIGNWWQPIH